MAQGRLLLWVAVLSLLAPAGCAGQVSAGSRVTNTGAAVANGGGGAAGGHPVSRVAAPPLRVEVWRASWIIRGTSGFCRTGNCW